jgi:hypothetical protein
MQMTLVQYSPRLVEEKLGRSQVFLISINCSKRVARTWKMMKEMKTMLITFFDIKGIIHFEFIPQGQTVNRAYYMEILKRLLMLCIEKGLNFIVMIGSSIVTMLQLRRRFLSRRVF